MGLYLKPNWRANQTLQRRQQLKQGEITEISSRYNGAGSGADHRLRDLHKLVAREPAGQRELNDRACSRSSAAAFAKATRNCCRMTYFEVLQTRPRFTTTLPTKSSSRARDKATA